MPGLSSQSVVQLDFRLGKASLACEDQSQINEGLRILRVVLRRLAEQMFGLLVVALLAVEDAQIALRFGVLRVQRDGEF